MGGGCVTPHLKKTLRKPTNVIISELPVVLFKLFCFQSAFTVLVPSQEPLGSRWNLYRQSHFKEGEAEALGREGTC